MQGIIAVTRALGDFELRPWVTSEPQVSALPRRRGGGEEGEVLVLASDGLWSCMEDEEAARLAASHAHPQQAAEALLAEVERRGGRDNISVVVARWGDEPPS